MEENPVRLRKLYAGWETEALKKAMTVDKANYEQGAINVIREELRSRNVDTEQLDSLAKDLDRLSKNYIFEEESLKNKGKLFCPKCHSLNIMKRTWRWWYFLTIPIIGVIWVLLELFNVGWLQLPLCIFLVFVLSGRKKHRCVDCGCSFGSLEERLMKKLHLHFS